MFHPQEWWQVFQNLSFCCWKAMSKPTWFFIFLHHLVLWSHFGNYQIKLMITSSQSFKTSKLLIFQFLFVYFFLSPFSHQVKMIPMRCEIMQRFFATSSWTTFTPSLDVSSSSPSAYACWVWSSSRTSWSFSTSACVHASTVPGGGEGPTEPGRETSTWSKNPCPSFSQVTPR